MADDPRIAFAFFKNPIPKGNGSTAKFKNPNFHFDIVTITERSTEVRLQMHGGQTDTVGVDHSMIFNTQFTGDQKQPEIAALESCGFVVVWSSRVQADDGSGRAIVARRYDADGTPLRSAGLAS